MSEFDAIENISFLKRSFKYHPLLDKIVAALDKRSIFSSICWIDSSKDFYVVLNDKINNFQRELFLHFESFEKYQQVLESLCLKFDIIFEPLDLDYLCDLYNNSPDLFFDNKDYYL